MIQTTMTQLPIIQLSREIRFALVPPDAPIPRKPVNSWGGWPSSNRLAPQLKLIAVIEGTPDPVTGYLCDITVLDRVLREIVVEELIPQFGDQPFETTGERVLVAVADSFGRRWREAEHKEPLVRLSLELNDQMSFHIEAEQMNMVQMTRQFEFSAAHRLHCASLSAEENRETFGKCNNPSGHGHNYVFDVTIEGSESDVREGGQFTTLEAMEQTVNREVVDRLDHRNLNEDVEAFSTVNPSVENIAIAIYGWLKQPLASEQSRLLSVKVYETPKTWAQFGG